MNLCHPDSYKSCSACCGVYNVVDGRREILNGSILERTKKFRNVAREVDALIGFGDHVRGLHNLSPLDPEIHVCEYVGFVDGQNLTVGCMLHPAAPGNNGVDLRGLCYYGSAACKTFYCPACEELSARILKIVRTLIGDWHLYGLIVTDVNYLMAVIDLIELLIDAKLDLGTTLKPAPAMILRGILAWKESWPYSKGSRIRRSGYYLKRQPMDQNENFLIDVIIDSLCFSFDISGVSCDSVSFVRREIGAFIKAYHQANGTVN